PIAKRVQENVLEVILKENSPQKAAEHVRRIIEDLKNKRIPYRDLVIWKTLTKPIEEYAVKAAHVEAAKMLMEKGWKLALGDKVGYVVVVGPGKLYEKAKPYIFASYDEIDVEYYIRNQVIPAAIRVLEFFGITEEQLLGRTSLKEAPTPKRLTDFF
ncbi:MAG: DNA polymerase domain-containing protein, partial [Candidatus Bathyarchaeia archaeon]